MRYICSVSTVFTCTIDDVLSMAHIKHTDGHQMEEFRQKKDDDVFAVSLQFRKT